MDKLLFSAILGLVIATGDVLPMIAKKLPRHTNLAAFVHYFIATVVIVNIDIPCLPWWLKGGVVGLALMIPTLIHVWHDNPKPVGIIAANAVFWGSAAGVAAHFML